MVLSGQVDQKLSGMEVLGTAWRGGEGEHTQQIDGEPDSGPRAEGVHNDCQDDCQVFQDSVLALCAEACNRPQT